MPPQWLRRPRTRQGTGQAVQPQTLVTTEHAPLPCTAALRAGHGDTKTSSGLPSPNNNTPASWMVVANAWIQEEYSVMPSPPLPGTGFCGNQPRRLVAALASLCIQEALTPPVLSITPSGHRIDAQVMLALLADGRPWRAGGGRQGLESEPP